MLPPQSGQAPTRGTFSRGELVPPPQSGQAPTRVTFSRVKLPLPLPPISRDVVPTAPQRTHLMGMSTSMDDRPRPESPSPHCFLWLIPIPRAYGDRPADAVGFAADVAPQLSGELAGASHRPTLSEQG